MSLQQYLLEYCLKKFYKYWNKPLKIGFQLGKPNTERNLNKKQGGLQGATPAKSTLTYFNKNVKNF